MDWGLDWITYVLAFYEGDLQFDNDPNQVLRTSIMALCMLSTVSWFLEAALFKLRQRLYLRLAPYFNFAHLLLEDCTQVVLCTPLLPPSRRSPPAGSRARHPF